MAGREQHSASAQSVQHAAAAALAASCSGPAPQPPSTSETLQALAPLTSALLAAGLLHNPAATAASVTLGTAAAGVAAAWPPPTSWLVTGRFPGAPVRAAAALSAVCRAPTPQHAMSPGAVRPPFEVGWSPCALSGGVGAMAGGGHGGIPPPAVRPMIPATAVGQPPMTAAGPLRRSFGHGRRRGLPRDTPHKVCASLCLFAHVRVLS